MTRSLEIKIDRTIRKKRAELAALHEEIEDLLDSLDLLKARRRNAGKPTVSLAEVKKSYGTK